MGGNSSKVAGAAICDGVSSFGDSDPPRGWYDNTPMSTLAVNELYKIGRDQAWGIITSEEADRRSNEVRRPFREAQERGGFVDYCRTGR